MAESKRKICFVVTSRVHYSRNKLLMKLVNEDKDIDTQVVVGGSALLVKYGNILGELEQDQFEGIEKLYTTIEGEDNIAMAKTTGLAIIEFTNALARFDPDIVVIRGDRYEMMAVAVAAAYLNKTIAHIEGGDVSGSIDESVRHAITKLAHIHFATNEESKKRILAMGENPEFVYNVGSLDVEFLSKAPDDLDQAYINKTGVGQPIDFSKPYIIVMQHPVTNGEDNSKNIQSTLEAISSLPDCQVIWFWPNIDAGTDNISKALRVFRETYPENKIKFIRNLPSETFANLLKRSACLVGNSSAGIKESSFLGLPVVNIGSRQNGRLAGENVINVGYEAEDILEAVKKQLAHGPYASSSLYYKKDTSRLIYEILKTTPLYTQKKFISD